MYKRHFNRQDFIEARVAQLADHKARNLKVVGSIPNVGKIFLCILSLSIRSWLVDWSHTNETNHDVIRGIKVHRQNDHLNDKWRRYKFIIHGSLN